MKNKLDQMMQDEYSRDPEENLQLDYLKCMIQAIKQKDNAKDIFKYVDVREGEVNEDNIEVNTGMNE